MEYLLMMWPLFLGFALMFGWLFWSMRRTAKREERKHSEALAALASSLDGTVTGPDGARAWSADLRGPLASNVGGFINFLGTVRRPRFTRALDFQRGRWHVRVTEAAMKKAASTRAVWLYEHRIEVATVRLAPLKLMRRQYTDFLGRALNPRRMAKQNRSWVGQAPATAAREQSEWMTVNLPDELDYEFVVFTSDLSSASWVRDPRPIDWLLNLKESPSLMVKAFLPLTFESGFAYLTVPQRIDPETLVPAVDAIIGLLDRIPVAAPRHPATTA